MDTNIAPEESGIRDAIHVPVLSVLCNDDFQPGQKVIIYIYPSGTVYAGKVETRNVEWHGIIHPFNPAPKAGELAWVYMRPGITQGLKHVWESDTLKFPEPVVDDYEDNSCRGCY